MKSAINEVDAESPTVADKPSAIELSINRITEISTLPQIAMKVMEVVQDPKAGAGDLRKIVETDPALCGRIIRTVNSAAYTPSLTITNLQQAISLLGFIEIRNLAFTTLVAQIFREHKTIGRYRREDLWKHMVSVGICARIIAKRLKFAGFEDCYLAGLLHDIGIILEDQYFHPEFCRVIESLDKKTKLTAAEQQILGYDHTQLGAEIAQKWNFPPVLCAAIRYHHMSEKYLDEGQDIVRCIEAANYICSMKGITSVGMGFSRAPIQTMDLLNLKITDVVSIADELYQVLDLNESLIQF